MIGLRLLSQKRDAGSKTSLRKGSSVSAKCPFHATLRREEEMANTPVSNVGEKARENKERAEREARNQQHAGSCYQIPAPSDVASDQEVSGLPWGTFSMRHVVSRGHEAESRRSSGRGDYLREDGRYQTSPFMEHAPYPAATPSYQQHHGHGSFGGSSAGEDGPYYETDPQLFYGSSGIPAQQSQQSQYPPPPQQGGK
jgi:hypothetical protein